MFSRFFSKKPIKSTSTPVQPPVEPQVQSPPFALTWLQFTSDKCKGKLALSQTPGKKLLKGRNGKSFNRDLKSDLLEIKETHKISTIVCLLNKFELRTVGVNLDEYKKICEIYKIHLIVYPIIEMGVPEEDFVIFRKGILAEILTELAMEHNVLIHCRGGIGRAGTIACCVLLELKEKDSVDGAVRYLRRIRDKRCVESRKQYDFIKEFYHICCYFVY